jgi:deoxyhypusine synthase
VTRKLPELDLNKIRLNSLFQRHSKVSLADFAKPWQPGLSFRDFAGTLPNILAAGDLRKAARLIAEARKNGRTVMLAMGGHPIKVGLGPLLTDLMEKGLLDSISANGSVMVHDSEIALAGMTSEDVSASLKDGRFGVTGETGALISQAARTAAAAGQGLGRTLGLLLLEHQAPFCGQSVLAAAARLDIPLTIHAALGTDVYNIHPDCDGASLGQASMNDFHTFCRLAATLEEGAFINLGSAVIMPEVFLKALTLVRNLGFPVRKLTAVSLDFIQQYRARVNVVERPTSEGGQGFYFIGHHEIMFPLLMGLVQENLADGPAGGEALAGF